MFCSMRLIFISSFFFFFNDTATTEIYTTVHTLSLHDALPIRRFHHARMLRRCRDSTRTAMTTRSEEHTSELQSRTVISYAVFCLTKKKKIASNCKLTIGPLENCADIKELRT